MKVPRLIVLSLLAACLAFGQDARGTMSGTVTDPQGSMVPGAAVRLTNFGTNVSAKLASNASGSYEARLLLPGDCEVAVEAPGFQRLAGTNLRERREEEGGFNGSVWKLRWESPIGG
jgi:hypothetical protein